MRLKNRLARRRLQAWSIVAALSSIIAGCVSPTQSQLAQNDYHTMIAASLGYFQGENTSKHYEISDPWTAVTGEVMVCVAAHLPNGKGGFYSAADYSMYAMEHGNISTVMREAHDCSMNATYKKLEPIPRT